MLILWLVILFLCWGSFLNVVAYRITYDKKFFTKRSACPSCGKTIPFYDLIPVLSWLILCGRCRFCQSAISILYPFIEILSAVLLTVLFYSVSSYAEFGVYFLFLSALIVSVRTDIEEMVIPQIFTLWLIPVGILLSFFGLTRVSFLESVTGAIFGYGVLWLVAMLFRKLMKKEGLGVGDMELLGMIGSFLGLQAVWFSLFIGSLSGSLVGVAYLYFTKKDRYTPIPFGPFLILGAVVYFFTHGVFEFPVFR